MDLEKIINNIRSITDYRLLLKLFSNLNGKSNLLICNIILQHSDLISIKEIGEDTYENLIYLSISSNVDIINAYGFVNSELSENTYNTYLDANNNASANIVEHAVYIKSLKLINDYLRMA